MHKVRHNAYPKRGYGRSLVTASGGERAPIAPFWVRIMTSCIREAYIKGTHCLGSVELVFEKRSVTDCYKMHMDRKML